MKLYELINQDIIVRGVKQKSTTKKFIEKLIQQEELQKNVEDYKKDRIPVLLEDGIKACCKSYTSNKHTAVLIAEALVKDLAKRNYIIDLQIPEFNYYNDTERKLFLLKYFHPSNKGHTISTANDILWMYHDEKILDDLNGIRNGDLSFLGKQIGIDIDNRKETVRVESTAHPIILVENLTQVLTQLEGLRKMIDTPFEGYAMATITTIWSQLSDYARERIIFVLEELMDQDARFYKELNNTNSLFHSERDLSTNNRIESILYYLKNNIAFYIAYYNEQGKIIKKHCKINKYIGTSNFQLVDLDTNNIFTLTKEQIICTVEKKKDFVKYLDN